MNTSRPISVTRIGAGAAWMVLAVLTLWSMYDLWRSTQLDIQMDLPLWSWMLNLVLRMLPILLLVFAAGLGIEVLTEERESGQMQTRIRRLLFWVPRLGMIGFAAFLGLFALDVFGEGYSLLETIGALLIHLLPTTLMLVVTAVAWRWEWVGGVLGIGWALFYIFSAQGFMFSVYLAIAGVPFILGVLFFLNWYYRTELHTHVQGVSL